MQTYPNKTLLETFTEDSLPDLDTVVLGALELFIETNLPRIETSYTRPLVVGSGNAEVTGRILFSGTDAVFASESTYALKLEHIESIDGVVLVSASGGKHAPGILQTAQAQGKHVTLVTNNEHAPAREYANAVYTFPKNREPYTYNTSTYMGMLLGHTGEDPEVIHRFITERVATSALPDFSAYTKYYCLVPPQFAGIIRMLHIKFVELFGRQLARDIETIESVKHATTVVPSDELFISFGEENTQWGEAHNRVCIPLPENGDYASMMAVGYFLIGQIQKAHPPYFKENIAQYLRHASEVFGQPLSIIVE